MMCRKAIFEEYFSFPFSYVRWKNLWLSVSVIVLVVNLLNPICGQEFNLQHLVMHVLTHDVARTAAPDVAIICVRKRGCIYSRLF